MTIQRKNLMKPMNILSLYLLSTVFLFYLGPIEWSINKPLQLLFFLFFSYGGLYLGYFLYIKRIKIPDENYSKRNHISLKIRELNIIFLALSIFVILSHFIYLYYAYDKIILINIDSLGSSYADKEIVRTTFFTRIIEYTWMINVIYIPVGIFYYKKLHKLLKLLFVFSIFIIFSYWLTLGTLKGIADILIMLFLPVIYKLYIERKSKSNFKQNKLPFKYKLLIILVTLLFVYLFGVIMQSRAIHYGRDTYTSISSTTSNFIINEKLLPFPFFTNRLISYFTHAYTGLSYALDIKFDWTYGIGHSRTLTDIFARHFNFDVSNIILPERLDIMYGWDNGRVWPTALTWIGSDIPFILIPLLLFFVGYIFANYVFKLFYKKRLSYLLLSSLLVMFIFYLPANNQLFQSSRMTFSTFGIIFYCIFHDSIVNYYEKNRV
jgi:hypothetical protein